MQTSAGIRRLRGMPLVADTYGRSVVLHDPRDDADEVTARSVAEEMVAQDARITTVLWKRRKSTLENARRGVFLLGDETTVDRKIRENGVWYALDLMLNRDASLYPETHGLREWAKRCLCGATVLNTFAYTGSLGVAAQAGGAVRVLQTDRTRRFLDVGMRSCQLNGLPTKRKDWIVADFFVTMAILRREGALFGAVFLDPPLFSDSTAGRVDASNELGRLVDKVRPLVADGGALVVVHNGLFVSGQAFLDELGALCAGGYAEIEETIPVPGDLVSSAAAWPADPAPFNHPTKIAVLRIRRKDGRRA